MPPTIKAEFRPGNLDKNGFNMTARDFDRAIGMARLSGVLSGLLQYCREEYWTRSTFAKNGRYVPPTPFTFDIPTHVLSLRCDRKQVTRGIAALLKMRLILPVDGVANTFIINKDFRTWTETDGVEPLFNDFQIDRAIQAASLSDGHRKRTKMSHLDGQKGPIDRTKMSHETDKNVPETDKNVPSHIDEARPEFETRDLETNTPQPPDDGGHQVESASLPKTETPDAIAAVIEGVREAATRHRVKAGYPNDLGQIEDAVRHARMLCADFPPAAVFSAYLSAIESKTKPGKWAQWVATNLGRRIVREEKAAERIKTGPASATATAYATFTLSPEDREKHLAFRRSRIVK